MINVDSGWQKSWGCKLMCLSAAMSITHLEMHTIGWETMIALWNQGSPKGSPEMSNIWSLLILESLWWVSQTFTYFGLWGFITPNLDIVLVTVQKAWDQCAYRDNPIAIIQANNPTFQNPTFIPHIESNLTEIITLMKVRKLHVKGPKGIPSPHYNILACSNYKSKCMDRGQEISAQPSLPLHPWWWRHHSTPPPWLYLPVSHPPKWSLPLPPNPRMAWTEIWKEQNARLCPARAQKWSGADEPHIAMLAQQST